MKIKISKLKDVDSYIANSNVEAQPILKEVRKIIKSTVPKAEESISWGMPFYKYHGTLARFAVYKNHVSVGFGGVLKNEYREMLKKKGYATVIKILRINFDQKVPTAEIKQILKEQAKMNETKLSQSIIK